MYCSIVKANSQGFSVIHVQSELLMANLESDKTSESRSSDIEVYPKMNKIYHNMLYIMYSIHVFGT